MKGWGLPALRLRALKAPRHSLETAGKLPLFNVLRYLKKDVGRCQGRTKYAQGTAPPEEGSGRSVGKQQLSEKPSGTVDIQERPWFAGSHDTLFKGCHPPRAKWLLHFILVLMLLRASSMITSVPGGGFRIILASGEGSVT